VNNEFWMPAPASGPYERFPLEIERLTSEEKAVLRRLMRGERPRKLARDLSPRRRRVALRQRRELLGRLGGRDLRSLVQIVMELGL
jgi:FixJ family two-component response regulator